MIFLLQLLQIGKWAVVNVNVGCFMTVSTATIRADTSKESKGRMNENVKDL